MEDHKDTTSKSERKLDDLLKAARMQYRVPPEADRERIWSAIESEAFEPAATRKRRPFAWAASRWQLAAASLLIGVIAGRYTAPGAAPSLTIPSAESVVLTASAKPYQQTTEEVLGRSAVLLAALRSSEMNQIDADQMSAQAISLLTRVRMLIDSPAANDPQLQNLLLDLETTLAQVARMQPSRGRKDINLINEAVAQRDIVPRIQSVVVELGAGGY
jgi:hypothetical protein